MIINETDPNKRITALEAEVERLNRRIYLDGDVNVTALVLSKRVVEYINNAERTILERKAAPIPGWLDYLRREAASLRDKIESIQAPEEGNDERRSKKADRTREQIPV